MILAVIGRPIPQPPSVLDQSPFAHGSKKSMSGGIVPLLVNSIRHEEPSDEIFQEVSEDCGSAARQFESSS